MQISSRFTIAVHILTCINYFYGECLITSDFLASSIQVNPVIIRRIILQLKAAGIINISRGRGGMKIAKPLEEITLYDVYKAVDCVNGSLFHFHENPNPKCPVGKNIHFALDDTLSEIQTTFEDKLKSITVKEIAEKI
ncbi:MAG: Rrf2 family transcriptional regulator [Synergistaceae bacterium]|nr:Rrf2 family transcriptional regulator [Synergistaceae bacterium]